MTCELGAKPDRIKSDVLPLKKGPTTKKCPLCGNTSLLHLISMNKKLCQCCPGNGGKTYAIPWNLDPGQDPLF
jgi:hypothetical protein